MKLTFDQKRNIAYLRFHDKTAKVDAIRVSDELNVDMAPDGTVYGIELLNANEQLQAEKNGALVSIDNSPVEKQAIAAVRESKGTYRASRRRRAK